MANTPARVTPHLALIEAGALWVFGDSSPAPLVEAAVDAILCDVDSPALAELAGLGADADWWEVRPVLERSFAELGLSFPDPGDPQTALLALRHACRLLLADRLAAVELVSWAHAHVGHDGPRHAQPLVDLSDELDELRWPTRAEADREARARAIRFLLEAERATDQPAGESLPG